MEREIKFQFVINGKELTKAFTLDEIFGLHECDIVETMEKCTCNKNESVNHCECTPQYEDSEITGKRQFICLKDKKGTEIYEGDIIKCDSGDDYETIEYCDRKAAFCLNYQGDKYTIVGSSDLKIIGNIYETPELLKNEL